MIIKGNLDRMAEEFRHPGGSLKTMLDAMEAPSHARQLLLQLNTQRTKGFLCDVIIVVQNALFRAHKNILAASSLYLKSLVVHDNLISLDHEMVTPGVFRVILDYIYTGRLFDEDQGAEPSLGAVLAAASYLQLLDLVALCKKKLKRSGKCHLRPGSNFVPYGKMGPAGRFRVPTPVIHELPPHPLTTHVGELYAPQSSQGPQIFPGQPPVLSLPPGLHPPRADRERSPIYGLDLSKKSPTSQTEQTSSFPHLNRIISTGDEGRESPTVTANGGETYPLDKDIAYPSKMETDEPSHSFPHLGQHFSTHLPHLHRPLPYPCQSSPEGEVVGRWVKHEPYPVDDDEDEEDEEECVVSGTGERGKEAPSHLLHHHLLHAKDKRGESEAGDGEDEKSGTGTGSEETGSSEGRPSPPGTLERFHLAYEPESFGDNLYVCIPCDKGFPSSEQLNAHVETHAEDELYERDAPGGGGGTTPNSNNNTTTGSNHGGGVLSGLTYPEGKVLGETIRPYRCSSCDKSYKDPATLRQHEKTHWLTRPYPCSICGKKFTQRGTMTRHMRSHLGLKPFACDACGMRFTRQYRLTEHMRIHSGEKPYECQVCGGKFAQQRNLISHMKMHGAGAVGAAAAEGKLKVEFGEGIYPLSKYAAEHLALKQEKTPDFLVQASQQLLAEAKAMESLYPLSKLAAEHLGLTRDKMDILIPPPQPLPTETHTIERYSPG